MMRHLKSRRSFVRKLGAGASAVLASVAGTARAETPKPDTSEADASGANTAPLRVALLEEEKILRKLHQRF